MIDNFPEFNKLAMSSDDTLFVLTISMGTIGRVHVKKPVPKISGLNR